VLLTANFDAVKQWADQRQRLGFGKGCLAISTCEVSAKRRLVLQLCTSGGNLRHQSFRRGSRKGKERCPEYRDATR